MELGLWSTVGLMIGFSLVVIVLDEIIHARRKARDRDRAGGGSH